MPLCIRSRIPSLRFTPNRIDRILFVAGLA
jgi:hypothetical protein